MNPFIERTIHWGILHVTLTYNFKNYTNITFVDEKLSLCDFCVDVIKEYCPIQLGIYQMKFNTRIQSIFWTVSNSKSTLGNR